jgi:hypothetical protein
MGGKRMIPDPKNFCGGNFQDWLEEALVQMMRRAKKEQAKKVERRDIPACAY